MTTIRKFAERLDRQANDGHGWNKAPQMLRDASRLIYVMERALRIIAEQHSCECAELAHPDDCLHHQAKNIIEQQL
jgi:hypothetical protein